LYEGLGSTRQLLDSSQTVTDTYQYEAFGNLMASTGSTPSPYRYVGSLGYYQIYPPLAGGLSLMHLGARYYMPQVGRFATYDPATRRHAVAAHKYLYVSNDPVGSVDPTGLYDDRDAPDRAETCLARYEACAGDVLSPMSCLVNCAWELGCIATIPTVVAGAALGAALPWAGAVIGAGGTVGAGIATAWCFRSCERQSGIELGSCEDAYGICMYGPAWVRMRYGPHFRAG